MKTQIYAIALAAMLVSTPVWAHGDEHVERHEATVLPAAGNEMKILQDGYTALQVAVNEKAFDKIHAIVEGMEPALKSIDDTHKNDSGIAGTTALLVNVLKALHVSGDAKNAEATASELKKLGGGLQLLKVRLEHDTEKK